MILADLSPQQRVQVCRDYVKKQKSRCAICGRTEYELRLDHQRRTRWCLDHCHTSGKTRGALCYRCNTGLGLFLDSDDFLQRAIAYLRGSRLGEKA